MFVNSPEKEIIGDDPAHEEGEERHEEELGDKTNQGSHWLFEHLDHDLLNNTNYSKNIITTVNNYNCYKQQQASRAP